MIMEQDKNEVLLIIIKGPDVEHTLSSCDFIEPELDGSARSDRSLAIDTGHSTSLAITSSLDGMPAPSLAAISAQASANAKANCMHLY